MKAQMYALSQEQFEGELNTAKDLVLDELYRRQLITSQQVKDLSKTIFLCIKKPS